MSYVLVTSREWNESLAKRLEEKTGHAFHLIRKLTTSPMSDCRRLVRAMFSFRIGRI